MIEDSGVENLLLCTPLSSLISSPHDGWIPPVSRTLFLPVPSTVYVDIKLWAQHSITGSWSQGFCITPFHTYTLLGVGMVACWEYRGCKSTSTYFLEQIYGGRCPPSETPCLVFFKICIGYLSIRQHTALLLCQGVNFLPEEHHPKPVHADSAPRYFSLWLWILLVFWVFTRLWNFITTNNGIMLINNYMYVEGIIFVMNWLWVMLLWHRVGSLAEEQGLLLPDWEVTNANDTIFKNISGELHRTWLELRLASFSYF